MKLHDLVQKSPEWLAYRAQHFNASDAPAMTGCSPYKTRAALLREMHTGLAPEVDTNTQRLFDNGHRFEALARPLAEVIVGEDLYPVVGSEGRLSASFDGLTLGNDVAFEHKTLNDELRRAFDAIDALGAGDDAAPGLLLPLPYRVQMEQQLAVSGAERVLFMATRWEGETCAESRHCWYYPDAPLRQQIVDGWAQFANDLAAYVPAASVAPAPVGKAPEALPALRIEVTGAVTASNLAEFKETALAAIRSVNRSLATDADFADAEKAVKWCGDVESRLAAAKEHALSQTASIDALFKTIDDISAEARRVRLDLDKLVTKRKAEVKDEAVLAARKALDSHVATVNGEIAPMRLQPVPADFAAAIKGKRSIDSMQDALDTTLAAAKIAADGAARGIRANVATFKAQADGLEFLFSDLGQIVHKAADDFAAIIGARISTHRAAEAERERKRKEAEALAEQQRAERAAQAERDAEARRIAALQQAEAAEAARAEATKSMDAAWPMPASVVGIEPSGIEVRMPTVAAVLPEPAPAVVAVEPRADEPATLKLGAICDRLGFSLTAAFVADTLGIKPAKIEGAARLFRESDFARICAALVAHVESVRATEAEAA